MTLTKTQENDTLTIACSGRLDSATAPDLESELSAIDSSLKKLVLDFAELSYISSAGLRVILSAQKKMNAYGSMYVLNVNPTIMEVFDITGFTDILTIQ